MSWNHRVMQFDGIDGPFFELHEVYYTKAGTPHVYTEHPVGVVGESINELRETLKLMEAALAKPVLTEKDFQRQW